MIALPNVLVGLTPFIIFRPSRQRLRLVNVWRHLTCTTLYDMSVFVPTTLEIRVAKLERAVQVLRRQVAELRREKSKPFKPVVEECDDESCSIT